MNNIEQKKLAEDVIVTLTDIYNKELTPLFEAIAKLNLKDMDHNSRMDNMRERFHKVASFMSNVTEFQCRFVELKRLAGENFNLAKDKLKEREGLLLESMIAGDTSKEERSAIVFAKVIEERAAYRAWEKVVKQIDAWMKILGLRASELSKIQRSLLGNVGMLKLERGYTGSQMQNPLEGATRRPGGGFETNL